MRIAWFSPFPPVRTGIAGRSAELVSALGARGYAIDPYPESASHDFPWRHRRHPYDLAVYQFGNSSHHDYEWPYALQYPGLVVLHDTHLHHARAALLLRERRAADYRAEFAWSHPGVAPDAAELAVAGFDSRLYYEWPMVRALVEASRLIAVHGHGARRGLLETIVKSQLPTPNSQTAEATKIAEKIVSIRLGEGELVTPEREARARREVRARYGIDPDAVLFGCFGGLTPEKRIPQVVAALEATSKYAPSVRLMLAGAPAAQLDLAASGLTDRAVVTGYLEDDEALTDHLAACDVSLNLRWPTARETSGPWLRALAAGKPTVITDLVHMAGLASLDPRTWAVNVVNSQSPTPNSQGAVCVAVDVLDEDHSLRLAMRRLAADPDLRARLGRAAREWWRQHHSVDAMVNDYERVMREAAAAPAPIAIDDAPAHLRSDGEETLRALLAPFGVESPL